MNVARRPSLALHKSFRWRPRFTPSTASPACSASSMYRFALSGIGTLPCGVAGFLGDLFDVLNIPHPSAFPR
ncbi:MAG TPA: hypothetical protein VFE72_04035, partial [Lysobacter sp.]|nr:hypothetical protein [Lysobacter sp.]